jgi:iron complex outermembrane receptor protein
MKEGEEGSWKNYDPSGKKGGGSTGLVVPPEGVVDKSRNTAGTYVDVEWEFADRFLLQLASRYEHYSDFGGNLAGKIAARYRLSD